MSLRVPLQVKVPPADAVRSIQSAVAAARGSLGPVRDDLVTCTLPLRGEPDKLAVVSDQDPSLLVIHVEVDVTKVTDGSLLMFRSQAPILYFVSQLQLDQTTLSAFVTTVNETVKSVHAGHRPPDYTP